MISNYIFGKKQNPFLLFFFVWCWIMVKENMKFDASKIGDIQKDVIHFERLIGDLIGILSKSISFCIHSGESINELVNRLTSNYGGMNYKNGDDPSIIIQESSYVDETDATMSNNDNGIDYIQFKSDGPLYSLPKRITNSLVGSYLYECSQEKRTIYGDIYLDYCGDETVAPLLIDSLMNRKVNINKLKIGDQIDLLNLFEYCELPIPEELTLIYNYRDHIMKRYEEGNIITAYINKSEDKLISKYISMNNNGYYCCNSYAYGNNCICIPTEEINTIDRSLLENEMYTVFGEKGREAVKDGWGVNTHFPHSYIVNKNTEINLMNWFGSYNGEWKLLFRASEHRYSAKEFHKYCDNKRETVTIIKHKGHDNHINIFGGFAYIDNGCRYNNRQYLFTLSNEHDIPPTKYNRIERYGERYNDYNYNYNYNYDSNTGPPLGENDIYISDDCHNNTNSYCYASNYEQSETTQKCSLFVNTDTLYNKNHFKVEEYEVWGRG
ncbi:hypothetical protein WA158_008214 [Blastocystis sp. Blastoise]